MGKIFSQETISRFCAEEKTLFRAISGEDAALKGAATNSAACTSAAPPIAPPNRLRLRAGADESRYPILVRSPGDAGAEFPGRAGECDCVLPPRLERVSRSGRSG